jgi:hypothetical protein
LNLLVRIRRAFSRDSRGGVLPVVAISLPVIFGFAMLAVDAGRYFNLHTSCNGRPTRWRSPARPSSTASPTRSLGRTARSTISSPRPALR